MKQFFYLYSTLVLTFINKRLIYQIDLIFSSVFGSIAIAAAGVPNSLMVIDQITALAITPILVTKLTEHYKQNNEKRILNLLIPALFKLSVILSTVGFIVYPKLLNYIVKDSNEFALISSAIFWLNCTTISEFFRYCLSLCLNSNNKNHLVLRYSCLELLLKLVLNFIFVKFLLYGFEGLYIATFITSSITCLLTYKEVVNKNYFLLFNSIRQMRRIYEVLFYELLVSNFTVEFFRIFVEKISFVIIIYAINCISPNDLIMSAFTIAMGFYFLILMTQIALMRTINIYSFQFRSKFEEYKNKITFFAVVFTTLLSVIILFTKYWIIENVFHIYNSEHVNITSDYISMVSILLVFNVISSIQRGRLYVYQKNKCMAYFDIIHYLLIIVPLFIAGLLYNNTYLSWSGFFLAEINSIIFFKITLNKEINNHIMVVSS